MSGDAFAPPTPAEIDETRSMELRSIATHAVLRGSPTGNKQCENCVFYLENTADISYCWHPRLRILVGASWWCQWWEPTPADSFATSA